MKSFLAISLTSIALVACATSNGPASSRLPDGNYTFKGFDAGGRQLGGTVRVTVPFNDASFATGILCSNKGTVVVKATKDSGEEFAFQCIVNGKPAS